MSEYLYLIRCKEAYKIGVATDVRSRIAQLQTGNPYELELVDCWMFPNAEFVERALHQKYDYCRMIGEWFSIPNVTLGEFEKACEILGGVRVVGTTEATVTNDEIDEAEEIDKSLEDVRTELRMENGAPRGIVLVTRSTPKRAVRYIGKTNEEFGDYLRLYIHEHPNSKIMAALKKKELDRKPVSEE